MSYRLERRRRLIAVKGRPMLLARANNSASVTVQAYAPPPTVSTVDNGVPRQAFVAQITNDEIMASPNIDKPLRGDRLTDGASHYTLTDIAGVHDGPVLIGWVLIAAGGT